MGGIVAELIDDYIRQNAEKNKALSVKENLNEWM